MLKKKIILSVAIALFLVSPLASKTKIINPYSLSGNWHLRIMDGMEVRKARAILDFSVNTTGLSGFDACNRISGILQKNSRTNTNIPILEATNMECRGHLFSWVRTRLHETLREGFYVRKARKNGVNGIVLRSYSHELFFAKMQKKKKKE